MTGSRSRLAAGLWGQEEGQDKASGEDSRGRHCPHCLQTSQTPPGPFQRLLYIYSMLVARPLAFLFN